MPLSDLFGLLSNQGGLPIPASNLPNLQQPGVPGTNIFGGQFGVAGGPGGVTGLFQDRNFLKMLAGMGTGFGQGKSAGEAIGVPTADTIAALSSQQALQGAEAKREAFNKQILSILGGLTPDGEEGFTNIKGSPGKVSLDLTPPAGGVDPFEFNFTDPRIAPGANPPAGFSAPGAAGVGTTGGAATPIAPGTPGPVSAPTTAAPVTAAAPRGVTPGGFKFSDIAPF